MKHLLWLVGLFLLMGCSTPSGPDVVTLDDQGLTPVARRQGPIAWTSIESLQLEMHPISEEESAPLLIVTSQGRSVEVCSAYPHRVDPQSYAGAYNGISVSKESFLRLRDTIVSAAGLVPDQEREGRWIKGSSTPNLTVEPASFSHGFAPPQP